MNGRIAARAAWGAALAAVLVLSGCVAEPAPTPSPTASPSRTPSATPTPTSTPTPDGPQPGTPTPSPTAGADPSWPAYDPADPGTWTIDFSGIGPFTVGRPMEEQVAAFTGLARDDCGGNPGVASYHAPGTWLAAVEFNGGDVGLVSAAARSGGEPAVRPHTAEGIRPGDSVAAVLAAYPGIQAHVHSSSASYFLTDGTTWINFVVEGADSVDALHPDDVVGLITVGTLEFAPKEICG
ncbi:hypothetical protein NY547_02260 [Cnuibacter physcomitrellae]|uniref:hypothetical protein n=1 Tax=Cnuibacter physcomitrellae TaxID=1619308 RepID=UPI002175B617|nr:hypothetical protein [Cnuibacter physcomitrellae]MCS5496061.1 hypothetical protein [Cnuibacter physcomitrellae]